MANQSLVRDLALKSDVIQLSICKEQRDNSNSRQKISHLSDTVKVVSLFESCITCITCSLTVTAISSLTNPELYKPPGTIYIFLGPEIGIFS